MFERPTVFVVGAGASAEVRFPLGYELNRTIARRANFVQEAYKLKSGDPRLLEIIKVKYKGDPKGLDKALEAASSISSAVSQSISIDNFLHTHSDDEHLIFVAKAAIALSILESERNSLLMGSEDWQQEPNLSSTEDTWYNTFFKMLHEGVRKSDLKTIFDNVSIISFNYDRCIEHYLSGAIANYYRVGSEVARSLVSRLHIEHPYGQVGHLPWQESNGTKLKFGSKFNSDDIISIIPQIRTFTERVENDHALNRIHDLLKSAYAVVYLGFSYGDMNMKLLWLEEQLKSPIMKAVFGTCYKTSLPNVKIIDRDIRGSLNMSSVRDLSLYDTTCNQFLKDYWRPILRG